jgi:uncharacterized protein YwbE
LQTIHDHRDEDEMNDIQRDELQPGMLVAINPRDDRTRKKIVEGSISEILTGANEHPHIKTDASSRELIGEEILDYCDKRFARK